MNTDLARWQFGITTVYHFIFVPLTIGLAPIVAIMQTAWVRTGAERWLRLTKFFGNIPPDVLNSLADTVNAGAKREKSHKAPGLLHLLWRLRNKDSRRAVAVAPNMP